MAARDFVISFSDLLEKDENLGEKVNQIIKLKNAGFEVPPGFVIRPEAFIEYIRKNKLDRKIKHLLNSVDLELPKSVKDTASYISKHFEKSTIPEEILKEIVSEYKKIGGILHHSEVSVHLSRPGVLKIELVKGDTSVLHSVKSFWTKIFGQENTDHSIVVQKNIVGKIGKIRSSSKLIRTSHDLSRNERESLESLVEKFKKHFYLPHEIDFVIKGDKTYILKITPESHIEDYPVFPETHYKIIKNSHHLI